MRLIAILSALCAALALSACDDMNPDRRATAPTTTPEPPAAQAPASEPTTPPSAAADAAITDRVMAALAAANNVDESAITVETVNGRVVLSGQLPNQVQIDRAVTAAKTVEGVREVENRLTVG